MDDGKLLALYNIIFGSIKYSNSNFKNQNKNE